MNKTLYRAPRRPLPQTPQPIEHAADAWHWDGIPFPDLEVRHWLPHMLSAAGNSARPTLGVTDV